MTRRLKLSAAALASLLWVLPAVAGGGGGQDGDWEFGPYGGLITPDNYGGADPDGATLFGVRVGYFLTERWSAEGSWQSASPDANGGSADLTAWRGNMLYNFRPEKKLRWFLTAGLGRETIDAATVESTDTGFNAGGGARWYFGDERHWGLRVDARWVSIDGGSDVDGSQTNFEATGGIHWTCCGGPPPDADGDGVPDASDACANTPKGARVDSRGCILDADGDGIADNLDKCAATPAGWKVDAQGCPADADADGVADQVDACAKTAKGVAVNDKGCPREDADGDTVGDAEDRCPATPAGVKVDPVGCPIDTDRDGVYDGLDKCPETPAGTAVGPDGCAKK